MGLDDIIAIAKLGYKVQQFNKYTFEKVIDGVKTVIKFIGGTDTDGDGSIDTEEDIYTLETALPLSLDNGLTLCNSGDEVGLGYPALRLVSAEDVLPYLQDTDYTGDGNFFVTDLDGDGYDDVLKPLPYDGDGDGVPDFQIFVDDDDNGLPDVSPQSPFYAIGTVEFNTYIEEASSDRSIMDTPLDNYSVTEGLLLIVVIMLGLNFVRGLFARKDVFR